MSDYFDRIEQQLVRRVEAGAPRTYGLRVPWGGLAAAAVVLVVVAIAGAFLLTLRSGPAQQVGSRSSAGSSVTLSPPLATPLPTVDRVVSILRERAAAVVPGVDVSREGAHIAIHAAHRTPVARPQILALAAPGRLALYDWEKNALLPSGKTVASQLNAQDPTAIQISQGGQGAPPGEPGAGSLSLYQAVVLAADQPYEPSDDNSRLTPQYFLFGTPGSAACTTAARDAGTVTTPRAHCLLSGPADTLQDLYAGLPTGVSASHGQLLTIKRGTVVLQAANTSAKQIQLSSPKAQFYVLKDHVALSGKDITDPRPSTDQGGNSAVSFGFTSHGQSAFQKITSDIAHRGQLNSTLGPPHNQHFAVALDNQLITVPQIDFRQYPDGIDATNGADIVGNLTPQTAKTLSVILRFGPLPVTINPIP
jgi:SecD/SecF fusion protein